ncbi:Na(+)/H(+) antiporter subunit B [Parvularcula sp. ZS-1/3]|uniref:Na(+)/H(+) antiporter subunit B n=1 Tax=Parvularcula mediterranea TaxID=2732508 RepID=A0A7Y3RN33_9PROT|nr:Na(+)/H(+) antiporter subunit B [Parvularcula mediterranea]NNU16616.1 Na(+)/H(+) antiporter subunit B [Parvularcula mediterranea]
MGHLILRVTIKLLFAPILLFALYVQFHGDYGPGGGFQAGVIFAAAFILHALGFGLGSCQRVIPPNWLPVGMALGVLIYMGCGFYTMFLGGNFLDYDVIQPDSTHHAGQHIGIVVVEIGVGLAVAATMLQIFYAFAGREPEPMDDAW